MDYKICLYLFRNSLLYNGIVWVLFVEEWEFVWIINYLIYGLFLLVNIKNSLKLKIKNFVFY